MQGHIAVIVVVTTSGVPGDTIGAQAYRLCLAGERTPQPDRSPVLGVWERHL